MASAIQSYNKSKRMRQALLRRISLGNFLVRLGNGEKERLRREQYCRIRGP